MKKISFLAVAIAVMLMLNACSGGADTSGLSENLKAEYEFYEDSIGTIKSTMGLSQEEADSVFTILVTECGVDEKTQYVFKGNGDNVYTVWAGLLQLEVTLKDNAVDTVMQGTEQIYPAVHTQIDNEAGTTSDKEKITELSGHELITIDGHPVLYDYLSTAHKVWDEYADGRIDFADDYSDDYKAGKTVLVVDAYTAIEQGKEEHEIKGFEIYPSEEMTLDNSLEIAKSYIPMDILEKWYSLAWSRKYIKEESERYEILYTPTENGKAAFDSQEKDYNYVAISIHIENGNVEFIGISSTNPLSRMPGYQQQEWEYDLLNK